jgi:hypothetical protein
MKVAFRVSLSSALVLGCWSTASCSSTTTAQLNDAGSDAAVGTEPAPPAPRPTPPGLSDGGLADPLLGPLEPVFLPKVAGSSALFENGFEVDASGIRANSPLSPSCGKALCMDMTRYWPRPPSGTMQIKHWAFLKDYAATGAVAERIPAPEFERVQAYFQLKEPQADEFVLADFLAGSRREKTGEQPWAATWHVRNRPTDPRGVVELWGKSLEKGEVYESPGFLQFRRVQRTGATLSETDLGRFRTSNQFSFVGARDGVVVGGERFDQVAVVRVDQRPCASLTQCEATPLGTAAGADGTRIWYVHFMYMAPNVGLIAMLVYVGSAQPGATQFTFGRSWAEVVVKRCEIPVFSPAPQYDWQLAFDPSLERSLPTPRCP